MSQTQYNPPFVFNKFDKIRDAKDRYNLAYDNRAYMALRLAAREAFGANERDYLEWCDPRDVALNDFMNLVIDAALERCGDPYYHGRVIAVCSEALDQSDELAARLDAYLCRFNGQGSVSK